MPKSRNPGYQGGNNWGICDRCGQAYRQTELVDQHDGLRVCVHDCYDKRHPQEAVRDKGWECGGDGAQGTGLDWNGAGRLARPDVDPLSFIQEPNDAYFTNLPSSTFGDYRGEEEVFAPSDIEGLWSWIDGERPSEFYQDVGETTSVSLNDRIGSINQTSWLMNDSMNETYQSSTEDSRPVYVQGVNGKAGIYIADTTVDSGAFYSATNLGISLNNGVPMGQSTLFVVSEQWDQVRLNNSVNDEVVSININNPSGGLQWITSRFNPNEYKLRWWVGATTTNTSISVVVDEANGIDETGSPLLLTKRIEFDGSFTNLMLRKNLTEEYTKAISLDLSDPNGDYYWLGRGIAAGSFPKVLLEVIVYNRPLTDSEIDQVENYLQDKYNITS